MKTKSILLLAGLNLFANMQCLSQGSNFAWAKQMGDFSIEGGNSITTDASGNIYTTGFFRSTVDFDPGPGIFNLTATGGGADIFVQKLNPNGGLIWAEQIGGIVDDVGRSLTLDASGNLLITGTFGDIVDFDPGPGTFNLTGHGQGADVFVLKLDSSGNFIWAKNFGGTGNWQTIYSFSIATDPNNSVLVTGEFNYTIDFDPGPGIFNLTSDNSISAGFYDIFIAKLDSNGNFNWAKQIGGSGIYDIGFSITTDAIGNVYVTGTFQNDTVDFDPGPGTFNLSGGAPIFIEKLNANGNFVWAKQMGGMTNTGSGGSGYCLKTDGAGNLFTYGFFIDTVDFDPGAGVFNLISTPSYSTFASDIFIQKLDSNGNFVWAKQIGSHGPYNGGLTLDNSGNIYLTGIFSDTSDFDPGQNICSLISRGIADMFIEKLDANGNFLWVKQVQNIGVLTANSGITGSSIAVDNTGNIYTTGAFSDTVDFDPGQNIFPLQASNSNADIFIQKLGPCAPTTYSSLMHTVCDTDIVNGQIYTSTGIYIQFLTNFSGCDSVLTINLTVNPPHAFFTVYPDTVVPHHWFVLNQCTGNAPLTYSWDWGDGSPFSSGATPSHIYSAPGYYNICVTVIDSSGCTATYCDSSTYIQRNNGTGGVISINVLISTPTSVSEMDERSAIRIYPNPTSEEINIVFPDDQTRELKLFDATGKLLFIETGMWSQKQVALGSKFAEGIYILQVKGTNGYPAEFKIVKLKR